MKAAIEEIIIKERIRKDITKISELAEDIKKNGLINPITVMVFEGGKYQLLAGLRRIKAVQSIGFTEIEVNAVPPADAEAALRIEYSENDQRVDFTYSEKMDFANLIKDIETAKAKERMLAGKPTEVSDPVARGPQGNGKSREAIGAQIGMSGRQYDRAKYIADNAPLEVIEQLDKGERTIRGTYDELRAKEKAAASLPADTGEAEDELPEEETASEPVTEVKVPSKAQCEPLIQKSDSMPEEKAISEPAPQAKAPAKPKGESFTLKSDSVPEEEQMKYLSEKDKEAVRKLKEFNALPPEGKIAVLQRQLKDMRVRAVSAESDLANLKLEYGIKPDHKDSIIESLKQQNAELSEALDAASKRLAELEK